MVRTDFLKLAKLAAKIADDKKASDVLLINVSRLTAVTNYFVICTANSSTQLAAVLDAIHKEFNELGLSPVHREGRHSPSWAVIDYGGLVVHVMTPQARALFALEKLWSSGRKIKI